MIGLIELQFILGEWCLILGCIPKISFVTRIALQFPVVGGAGGRRHCLEWGLVLHIWRCSLVGLWLGTQWDGGVLVLLQGAPLN